MYRYRPMRLPVIVDDCHFGHKIIDAAISHLRVCQCRAPRKAAEKLTTFPLRPATGETLFRFQPTGADIDLTPLVIDVDLNISNARIARAAYELSH